ncbi:MAG: cation:proton antiporter [Alphaproteobacteria bacterium]|nr:cation:proton antiporter [Alphaproteobacteria bacterium]
MDPVEVASTQAPHAAVYRDALIVLVTAALIVPLLQRLNVNTILGFLLTGALLGPSGLGSFASEAHWLTWITVNNDEGLGLLGELGVVFLLFLVGLELSFKRLVTMRRLVFGLGGMQVLISATVIGAFLLMLEFDAAAALIIALSLALSSTAIVVEVLSGQHRLATTSGRATFSILLLQDLAVVPLLLLVTIVAPAQSDSAVSAMFQTFGQASVAIGLILAVGSVILRPLFRLVASSDNKELFVAATLLVAVGSGLATAAAGLSMALGAFIAGLLLAETEFRRAIEATIDPFKGLLLGVFFFVVGMSLDFGKLLQDPVTIVGAVVGLIVLKAIVVAGLMRSAGFSWADVAESSLLLGPCGEFAFIVASLAIFYGVLSPELGANVKVIAAFSMALIPALDSLGRRLTGRLSRDESMQLTLASQPDVDVQPRAIVIGYGRVGALVSQMLTGHGIPHVVTDVDADIVMRARAREEPVFFGDAKSMVLLERLGIAEAQAVIITLNTPSEIDHVVACVRAERPDVVIISRARDAEHARHLYQLGVTDAVPETIEASLQLSEAALVGLDIPVGPVIASIHEKRDEFRDALLGAAGTAGKSSRAIRPKAVKENAQQPAAETTGTQRRGGTDTGAN